CAGVRNCARRMAGLRHDHVFHKILSVVSRIPCDGWEAQGGLRAPSVRQAVLAASGLDAYPRTEIWKWLKARAGWSRILPFEQGAAYYISRYIGRDANHCDWFPRVGEEEPWARAESQIGKVNIVNSADLGREFFKRSYKERKR